MPNKRNQLVPIFNELYKIDYNLDKNLPELLNKSSATLWIGLNDMVRI